ncbi:hypothetical protein IV203_025644 [Nitzschia inconspicua]|uniref:Uncharacterized protein n=1 Tax=Nitzschia inconspicua TaxID=303405 RepID=A0A9K3PW87_9STRA|nr:hypothetical protein IV203_025644 [Nitzschia inconspicua]
MGMLEDIKENNITKLDVSIPAEEVAENIYDLTNALRANTSIEIVHFDEDFLGDLTSDSRFELLVSLGFVSSLKEVHLSTGLLMIKGISEMIKNAKSLRVLTLNDIVLQGTEDDFLACENLLYQHPNLKQFEMHDCDAAVKEISLENLEKAGKKKVATGSIADPVHSTRSAKTA